MRNDSCLDVRRFSAVGDGKTDDTAAIQKAIDAAEENGGEVCFPAGVYLCSTLRHRPFVTLRGCATWNYWYFKGSVIRLCDEQAPCLLDMTGAKGAVVDGLALDGELLGSGIHGVMVDKPDYGGEGGEDAIRIERSLVRNFTGDGLHLNRIWVFSVRHSMVSANRGNGIRVRGWDGFILDTWLSANHKPGYGAYEENAAVTMTGNRIESAGILIHGGNNYNITGNYFDRTSGPAICLLPRGEEPTRAVTVTGNILYRSGEPEFRPLEENESCHALFEHVRGLTFTGNTMRVWRDDGDEGRYSPRFGIVYGHLQSSVIQGNGLDEGALEQLLVDLGGHGEGVVVRDNPGSLFEP